MVSHIYDTDTTNGEMYLSLNYVINPPRGHYGFTDRSMNRLNKSRRFCYGMKHVPETHIPLY